VWGGFSESDRAALRQLGWRDTLDRRHLADIPTLEARLAKAQAQARREREERNANTSVPRRALVSQRVS
jgi:hypothetical protein